MSQQINVSNLGPIEQLSFALNSHGVTVLTAPNGSGKSILIDALQRAASRRSGMHLRDGAKKGEVEAFGVTVKFGKSTRFAGQLEVLHLEGRCDLASLVDPGLKSEEAADRHRIKSLVGLTGVTADRSLFTSRPEFEGMESVVNASSLETSDLVEMASRIKRDYESAARETESAANKEEGAAKSCEDQIKGVEFETEVSKESARQQHVQAVSELSAIESRRVSQQNYADQRRKNQDRLRAIREGYQGKATADTLKTLGTRSTEWEACNNTVSQLKEQLARAEQHLADATTRLQAADEAHVAAQQHEYEIAELEYLLNSDAETSITDEQIDEARGKVALAEEAYNAAVLMERHVATKLKAEQHRHYQTGFAHQSESFRKAARATDDVISAAIQCDKLRVVIEGGAPRLVVDHPIRGKGTPFHELSEGERWRIAIDLGAEQVGKDGFLVIPQEAWESLDCFVRPLVHEHAVERQVYILTAEATRDEEDGHGIQAKQYDTTHRMN